VDADAAQARRVAERGGAAPGVVVQRMDDRGRCRKAGEGLADDGAGSVYEVFSKKV
jgi:hypothetical protein